MKLNYLLIISNLWKQICFFSVTEEGISIFISDEHCSNELLPVILTEGGIITSSNEEQFSNVQSLISVIEDEMFLSAEQFLRADSSVTEERISIIMRDVQL